MKKRKKLQKTVQFTELIKNETVLGFQVSLIKYYPLIFCMIVNNSHTNILFKDVTETITTRELLNNFLN